MKIVADAHIPHVQSYFREMGELILIPGRLMTPAHVREADVLLVRSVTRVDQHLLDRSRVRFVGSVTAGADHLDGAWLTANGIAYQVAAGFNAPAVADYVMSVVAVLQQKQLLHGPSLRAAVIGVGQTGTRVKERLAALGFDVICCDPLREYHDPHFSSVSLSEVMDCDLISLHVPLTKTGAHPTEQLINQSFLQRQKQGCVLLNTSRGAVINTAHLKTDGTHLHWCFDVWEHEPEIDQDVLARALIATPHLAGYSIQSRRRGIERIYRAFCAHHLMPLSITTEIKPVPHRMVGQSSCWQAIVLSVFHPLMMTARLKHAFSGARPGEWFDALRRQCERHEFAHLILQQAQVLAADQSILKQLGFHLYEPASRSSRMACSAIRRN